VKRALLNAISLAIIASISASPCAQTTGVRRRAGTLPPPTAPALISVTPWTVEITTDGGLDGRGSGALKLSNDGTLTVTPPRAKHACTYQLTQDEMLPIGDLVGSANPQQWLASYADASNPNGCCDMIRTTLVLTRDDVRPNVGYTASWYDAHRPLPADLAAIADALFSGAKPASLRARYIPLCMSAQ
jgi:hypothetical protein